MGATDMFIGGNTLEDTRTNEVVYYDSGRSPYGMNVVRMDSHGGWIASPIHLLKFMVNVDGFNTVPDYLQAGTITEMTTPSTANSWYALGWSINSSKNNWWHTGSLPGTKTILARISSGEYTWAFMCNSREQDPDVDALMWDVKNGINSWPTIDLFD